MDRCPLKILFLSDHFYPEPSAPAAHVFERAALWVSEGHSVTVVTSAPNFPEGRVFPGYRNSWRTRETLKGIRVVRVKTYMARNEGSFRRTLDYLSYMVSSFLFAFGEERPDVVVSTSPHLFVAVAGVMHASLRRVPHVFELRDLWPATIAANTGACPAWPRRGCWRWSARALPAVRCRPLPWPLPPRVRCTWRRARGGGS